MATTRFRPVERLAESDSIASSAPTTLTAWQPSPESASRGGQSHDGIPRHQSEAQFQFPRAHRTI